MRADAYDLDWLLRVSTVANVAWLTESLAERMSLEPGMRVLDLGCGTGGSSILLAREYGVTVHAVDAMIRPDEIFEHVEAFGLSNAVLPQHGDARRLPFPSRYFDAVVAIGAFHYFATENMYLTGLSKLVRPGGQIGIVSEGLSRDIDRPPEHFSPSWRHSFALLHTAEWWRRHWEREGFPVESADLLPDGVACWADWYELCIERGVRPPAITKPEAAMLRSDGGRTLGFVRAITRVPG